MKTVVCPNPNCAREDVKVDEAGVMESHYPSPKKTLSPEHYCRLSGTVYTGEDVGSQLDEPKSDRPKSANNFVGGLRTEYEM